MNYQQTLLSSSEFVGQTRPANILVKSNISVEDLAYLYAREKAASLRGSTTVSVSREVQVEITRVPYVS